MTPAIREVRKVNVVIVKTSLDNNLVSIFYRCGQNGKIHTQLWERADDEGDSMALEAVINAIFIKGCDDDSEKDAML